MLGKNTSRVEVQDITPNGVWLFAKGREFLLSFADHPWFKTAKISAVYNVKLLHESHLHWPDLDVDLDIKSLERPGDYPLISKGTASQVADRSSISRRRKRNKTKPG